VPCRGDRDPLITAVDIIWHGTWERDDKWDMGKQLDYLKAYIRPFTTKIKKNFKLNEDSCKLFPDSIRVSPEYESILSLLQRVAFYSLNASM